MQNFAGYLTGENCRFHLCKINAETDLSCDEFWNNGVSYKNQRESGFQLYAKMVSCYHYFT